MLYISGNHAAEGFSADPYMQSFMMMLRDMHQIHRAASSGPTAASQLAFGTALGSTERPPFPYHGEQFGSAARALHAPVQIGDRDAFRPAIIPVDPAHAQFPPEASPSTDERSPGSTT